MGIIDNLINFFKVQPKEETIKDILVLESSQKTILRSFSCPQGSDNNVFSMFYKDFTTDPSNIGILNGCILHKYDNANAGKNNKIGLVVYAPEALFIIDKAYHTAVTNNLIEPETQAHIKHELDKYNPEIVNYAYSEYSDFLRRNGLQDTNRSEIFYVKAIERGNCINDVPENAQTDRIRQAAVRNQSLSGTSPQVIANTQKDIYNKRLEIMEEFISKRFERDRDADMSIYGEAGWFEYYKNMDNIKNPLKIYPDLSLSVQDWHYLCSLTTELISNKYVPNEVLQDPAFWGNYTDLIGKGSYLENPDKIRYMTFDEAEVFNHMPAYMREDPEVQKTLLASRAVSTYFFGDKLANDVWKTVPPEQYRNIPDEIRSKDDFRGIGVKAVKNDIQNLNFIPNKFIEDWMIEKAIKHDMTLLCYIPDERVISVPGIEQKLLNGIINYQQQDIFSATDLPGEHGLVAAQQRDAKDMLRFIPEQLRTNNICKAALKISKNNMRYVPDTVDIRQNNETHHEMNKKQGYKMRH